MKGLIKSIIIAAIGIFIVRVVVHEYVNHKREAPNSAYSYTQEKAESRVIQNKIIEEKIIKNPKNIYAEIQKDLNRTKFPIPLTQDNGIMLVSGSVDSEKGIIYYNFTLNYGSKNNRTIAKKLMNNKSIFYEEGCRMMREMKVGDKSVIEYINGYNAIFNGKGIKQFTIKVTKEICKKYK